MAIERIRTADRCAVEAAVNDPIYPTLPRSLQIALARRLQELDGPQLPSRASQNGRQGQMRRQLRGLRLIDLIKVAVVVLGLLVLVRLIIG